MLSFPLHFIAVSNLQSLAIANIFTRKLRSITHIKQRSHSQHPTPDRLFPKISQRLFILVIVD
ncbi:hypothetical protein [Pseudanabaena mucicola]|uniref:Uncharacterized protein n=1 Tax=Pseudanabaena mucicola FACHB-723 TaxID=2692860 RepID=A0ABR7ZTD1_9CYAN|nr:hypothetical protein [Pseudanabaena mucicola]MBD2186804.1 hypothetical protein [Pseudanabaena mucicola FACHB-723]